jgi:hypothetical protein
MRTQVFGELLLVASAADGDCAKTHAPRELDTKMPKSPHALHSY